MSDKYLFYYFFDIEIQKSKIFLFSVNNGASIHNTLSRSHNSLSVSKSDNNGAVSFEEMVKQQQADLDNLETQLMVNENKIFAIISLTFSLLYRVKI